MREIEGSAWRYQHAPFRIRKVGNIFQILDGLPFHVTGRSQIFAELPTPEAVVAWILAAPPEPKPISYFDGNPDKPTTLKTFEV